MAFFRWLLERLQEKTTWYGLTAIATSAGVSVDPNISKEVISTGVAVAGLISVIAKEKK